MLLYNSFIISVIFNDTMVLCVTCLVTLCSCVLSAEPALTQQRELGLDVVPQPLVHQSVPAAVKAGPGGDSLPAHRAAQSSFVHRL